MPTTQPSDLLSSPSRPKKSGGRWGRRLLILGGGLVALFLVASFVLSSFLDGERLAGWVTPRLEAAVNRDVDIDDISVGFLPVGVRLSGIRVSDPTGLAPALAQVSSVDLRVRLLPLLQRRVEVSRIIIDGMQADLRVGEDGESNFGDMSPEGEAPPPEPAADGEAFALDVQGIRLTSGRIAYQNAASEQAVSMEELEGESSIQLEAQGDLLVEGRFAGRASLSGVMVESGAEQVDPGAGEEAGGWLTNLPIELTVAMDVTEEANVIRIREGSLAMEELALALTGELRDLKQPIRQVELALVATDVPIDRVLSVVPDSVMDPDEVSASGTLSADLAVRGAMGPEANPQVTGTASVDGGTVSYRGQMLTEGLQLDLALTEGGMIQPDGEGQLLGGDFELDGTVMMELPRTVELRVAAAPDLGRIDPDLLPAGVTVTGIMPLDVQVSGDLENPRGLGAWGELGVRQLRATHPALGVPVSVATADLALEGRTVDIPETGITFGDERLTIAGVLTGLMDTGDGVPDFRGTARGPRISLERLKANPTPDTALTYGKLAFARVGDRQVRGLSADAAAREIGLSRPAALPLAGEVQIAIDTVFDRKGMMEDVEATVRFGPDFAQVSDARYRRYGGTIQAAANLSLGEDSTEPFSLDLVVDGVDAGAFLSETSPLGEVFTGTLDLTLDLTGALNRLLLPTRETLQGTGSFSLTGGGIEAPITEELADFLGVQALRSMRIQDWSTAFVLQDGLVLVDESLLSGAPGSPRVGGGIGLNGALDLTSIFDLPRSEVAASALADLGVPNAGELVQAVIRIGGQVGSPDLTVDPTATVTQVTDALENQAREEIDEVIEEQKSELEDRASSFLRGLLGGSTGAGADSVRPDSVLPDSVQPDSIRPDSTRRDTVPPAAGR